MRRTLYIPDDLWEQLSDYLEQHPQENASSVVQVALKEKLRPRNGERLLELAGMIESAPIDASTDKNLR